MRTDSILRILIFLLKSVNSPLFFTFFTAKIHICGLRRLFLENNTEKRISFYEKPVFFLHLTRFLDYATINPTCKAYVYSERWVERMFTVSAATMTVIWVVLLIVFLVMEAVTVQLVSAWFAVGALCALIANFCGLHVAWQIALFIVVSAICLVATRPLVKKLTAAKIQKTNADRCIGADAVVLEEINNLESTGQVKACGNIWTARSADNTVIPVGAVVTVERMEGVKLIVSNQNNS